MRRFLSVFRKYVIKFAPDFCLLAASIMATYIIFLQGWPAGDDVKFHFSQILDLFYSIKKGNLTPISPYLYGGIGLGKRLFYSPLPHLSVAMLGVVYSWFGASLLAAFKTMIFLNVFISAEFAYHFGVKIGKGKTFVGIIMGVMFAMYPYRLFCFFARNAFAEAFSIAFLPLFFMGLYDFIHKEEVSIKTFLEIIFGACGLYLSHNVTALYAFLFGVVYLLFFPKKIYQKLKNTRFRVYSFVSVALILGLCSIILFSSFSLLATKIYTISNNENMWTNAEHCASATDVAIDYSGFLNIRWLIETYKNFFTFTKIIIGVIYLIASSLALCVIENLLKGIKKIRNFSYLIAGVIYFGLIAAFRLRLELILAAVIFYIIFLVMNLLPEDEYVDEKSLTKNKDFLFALLASFISLVLIGVDYIWYILPDALLKVQFSWRIWSIFTMFIIMCFAIVLNTYYKKSLKLVAILSASLLMALNQGVLEKRLLNENMDKDNLPKWDPCWYFEINDQIFDYYQGGGNNMEYLPHIFTQSYESEYGKTLMYRVREKIWDKREGTSYYTIDPVALKGEAMITVTSHETPKWSMRVATTIESKIQMPLIYYPGYKIVITEVNTGNRYSVKGNNIDGLLSFDLGVGTYDVQTYYVGSAARNFGVVVFSFSVIGLVVFICLDSEYRRKKEIELKEIA